MIWCNGMRNSLLVLVVAWGTCAAQQASRPTASMPCAEEPAYAAPTDIPLSEQDTRIRERMSQLGSPLSNSPAVQEKYVFSRQRLRRERVLVYQHCIAHIDPENGEIMYLSKTRKETPVSRLSGTPSSQPITAGEAKQRAMVAARQLGLDLELEKLEVRWYPGARLEDGSMSDAIWDVAQLNEHKGIKCLDSATVVFVYATTGEIKGFVKGYSPKAAVERYLQSDSKISKEGALQQSRAALRSDAIAAIDAELRIVNSGICDSEVTPTPKAAWVVRVQDEKTGRSVGTWFVDATTGVLQRPE